MILAFAVAQVAGSAFSQIRKTGTWVPSAVPETTCTDPFSGSSRMPALVDESCERVTLAVVAGAPANQSLPRTFATAVPPAGEATRPRSSFAMMALVPKPVGRKRKTPTVESAMSGLPDGTTLNVPPTDAPISKDTAPATGRVESSVEAVQPAAISNPK